MVKLALDNITQVILKNKIDDKEFLKKFSGSTSLYEHRGVFYVDEGCTKLAHGKFIFVTPVDVSMPILLGALLNGANAHAKIATQLAKKIDDKPFIEAAYAGELEVDQGAIVSWNNQSNSFKCTSKDKHMARLPEDKFVEWEKKHKPQDAEEVDDDRSNSIRP
jgi:hypothetical protein